MTPPALRATSPGKLLAIRPTERDGLFDLVFRHVTVKSIDFHNLT
jgi:hypothetical protein